MKNNPLKNFPNSKKPLEPTFVTEEDEDNAGPSEDLDLPLFYTTQEQRDGIREIIEKAREE
jgi:hypothetical protein